MGLRDDKVEKAIVSIAESMKLIRETLRRDQGIRNEILMLRNEIWLTHHDVKFLVYFTKEWRKQMEEAVQELIAAVTEINGKADSLIETVNRIAALLVQNATNPARIRELANELKNQSAEIQAAIDANPAEPPPV